MSLLVSGTNVNARRLEWRMAHIPSTWWQPMVLAPLLCMRGSSRMTVLTRPNRCRTYCLGSRHSPSSYMAGLNPRTRVTQAMFENQLSHIRGLLSKRPRGVGEWWYGQGSDAPKCTCVVRCFGSLLVGTLMPVLQFCFMGYAATVKHVRASCPKPGPRGCCCLFSVCFGFGGPLPPALLLMMTLLFWGLPTHMGCVVQLLSVARLWRGTGYRCRNW